MRLSHWAWQCLCLQGKSVPLFCEVRGTLNRCRNGCYIRLDLPPAVFLGAGELNMVVFSVLRVWPTDQLRLGVNLFRFTEVRGQEGYSYRLTSCGGGQGGSRPNGYRRCHGQSGRFCESRRACRGKGRSCGRERRLNNRVDARCSGMNGAPTAGSTHRNTCRRLGGYFYSRLSG